jgi:hypothetical protein
MSTTLSPERLTITSLDREGWDQDELADGQGLGIVAVGFTAGQFESLPDNHPAGIAWDRFIDEVIEEVGPQVRDLLYAAIERRLPWTWEEPAQ